jgi:hypothetical protein
MGVAARGMDGPSNRAAPDRALSTFTKGGLGAGIGAHEDEYQGGVGQQWLADLVAVRQADHTLPTLVQAGGEGVVGLAIDPADYQNTAPWRRHCRGRLGIASRSLCVWVAHCLSSSKRSDPDGRHPSAAPGAGRNQQLSIVVNRAGPSAESAF